MHICRFIKGKSFERALADLDKVTVMRKVVPYSGEIPHRRGKGIMSGRYPVRSVRYFIPVIKNLRGNAIAAGLALDKTVISYASPHGAARPAKSRNRYAKRIHLLLKAEEHIKHG